MKHTPGPWTWWTSNSCVRLTGGDCCDGGVLAAEVVRNSYGTIHVNEANARLISAAPDLLEALHALWSHGHLISFSHDTDDTVAMKRKAIAAINKATGEG